MVRLEAMRGREDRPASDHRPCRFDELRMGVAVDERCVVVQQVVIAVAVDVDDDRALASREHDGMGREEGRSTRVAFGKVATESFPLSLRGGSSRLVTFGDARCRPRPDRRCRRVRLPVGHLKVPLDPLGGNVNLVVATVRPARAPPGAPALRPPKRRTRWPGKGGNSIGAAVVRWFVGPRRGPRG